MAYVVEVFVEGDEGSGEPGGHSSNQQDYFFGQIICSAYPQGRKSNQTN